MEETLFSDLQPEAHNKATQKHTQRKEPGFKEKLWSISDKMRGHMDPSEYKHITLGLIFLKFIWDRFQEHYLELEAKGVNPEDPQKYCSQNTFWVPDEARWPKLFGAVKDGGIGLMIDKAMLALEHKNKSLAGVLPKEYARSGLNTQRLGELVKIIGTVGLGDQNTQSQDVIGQVYEYFLARFAGAEGNKGGEFYTPRSVVKLLVEMIEPYGGKVYDPCCGSAGMFVQSREFVKQHGGQSGDVSIYGQESNPTTWRLAKMNLAIRGMNCDLGERNADTFLEDLHSSLEADYIMTNPPFNMSYWGAEQLIEDQRWQYGAPSPSNANFAWVQHIISHLAPNGLAGFVLSNGSLSSNAAGEGKLRQSLITADLVDCVVTLPPQLFYGTAISASLWFIARNKNDPRFRDRREQTLFIDARKMGRLIDRTHREIMQAEITEIADAYRVWRSSAPERKYRDEPGFCRAVSLSEIAEHKWALVPGRYVGFSAEAVGEQEIAHLRGELEEIEERLCQVSEASQTALAVLKGLFHGSPSPEMPVALVDRNA